MKICIELDRANLDQVMRLGRFPSKTAAVNAALSEYAKMRKCKELAGLRGRIGWQAELDEIRAMRPGGNHETGE